MKQEITKELLEDLYFNQGVSWKNIKNMYNISSKKLRYYKQHYQIRKKTKEEIQADTIKTNLAKFGCVNPMQNKTIQDKAKETIKRENVVEKRKQTVLKLYGTEIVSQNKQVLEKMYKTNELRYGSYCSCNNQTVKNKIIEKVTKAFSTGIPKQKEYETRRKNHSWNLSKREEQVYQLLLLKFSKEDIERQYRTSLYPFNCDFYIKSLDLYIEFQGTWVHGKEPFDNTRQDHLAKLQKWQAKNTEYFRYAIRVWTLRDPEKRKISKENNLNWKEFFTIQEVKDWLGEINAN